MQRDYAKEFVVSSHLIEIPRFWGPIKKAIQEEMIVCKQAKKNISILSLYLRTQRKDKEFIELITRVKNSIKEEILLEKGQISMIGQGVEIAKKKIKKYKELRILFQTFDTFSIDIGENTKGYILLKLQELKAEYEAKKQELSEGLTLLSSYSMYTNTFKPLEEDISGFKKNNYSKQKIQFRKEADQNPNFKNNTERTQYVSNKIQEYKKQKIENIRLNPMEKFVINRALEKDIFGKIEDLYNQKCFSNPLLKLYKVFCEIPEDIIKSDVIQPLSAIEINDVDPQSSSNSNHEDSSRNQARQVEAKEDEETIDQSKSIPILLIPANHEDSNYLDDDYTEQGDELIKPFESKLNLTSDIKPTKDAKQNRISILFQKKTSPVLSPVSGEKNEPPENRKHYFWSKSPKTSPKATQENISQQNSPVLFKKKVTLQSIPSKLPSPKANPKQHSLTSKKKAKLSRSYNNDKSYKNKPPRVKHAQSFSIAREDIQLDLSQQVELLPASPIINFNEHNVKPSSDETLRRHSSKVITFSPKLFIREEKDKDKNKEKLKKTISTPNSPNEKRRKTP